MVAHAYVKLCQSSLFSGEYLPSVLLVNFFYLICNSINPCFLYRLKCPIVLCRLNVNVKEITNDDVNGSCKRGLTTKG